MEYEIIQEDLQFIHSCSLRNTIQNLGLVGLWLGSKQAFATALYVVTIVSILQVYEEDMIEKEILTEISQAEIDT